MGTFLRWWGTFLGYNCIAFEGRHTDMVKTRSILSLRGCMSPLHNTWWVNKATDHHNCSTAYSSKGYYSSRSDYDERYMYQEIDWSEVGSIDGMFNSMLRKGNRTVLWNLISKKVPAVRLAARYPVMTCHTLYCISIEAWREQPHYEAKQCKFGQYIDINAL